ncbi:MAG: indole-3-glycerol phosphate synthase TrpC [Bacteroidales bacterium]|nr:indole-3-glycerol phosphate synthase TrpC [Bacteroidales bacterium]
MKTILDTIVEHKRMEVLKRKGRKPLKELMKKPFYPKACLNPMDHFKLGQPGIIAEFKRRSPSAGQFKEHADPVDVVKSYRDGGAVCSSILTDRDFFGGSFRDLEDVKQAMQGFPLLRKDFMIDPYQVHEAKAYGADMILLISAVLTGSQVREMTRVADDLGLTVLLEVHSKEDTDKWLPGINFIGVNNRDLNSFSVSLDHSVELFGYLPEEALKISESGLKDIKDIRMLFDAGYRGFLMGERFMKEPDPGRALGEFLKQLNTD